MTFSRDEKSYILFHELPKVQIDGGANSRQRRKTRRDPELKREGAEKPKVLDETRVRFLLVDTANCFMFFFLLPLPSILVFAPHFIECHSSLTLRRQRNMSVLVSEEINVQKVDDGFPTDNSLSFILNHYLYTAKKFIGYNNFQCND